MKEKGDLWKDYFQKWPKTMSRRGLVVNASGDQIPFTGFLTHETFLLIERPAPDSMGARTVIFPYGEITALKITDVVKLRAFVEMGFEGPLPKK